MIHLYSIIFNSELFLQFMIDHYRNKFPNCLITFYENQSTDASKEIALKNNCEIIDYNTNGILDDLNLIKLKNNCWKNSKTDWVIIVDPDELLNISEDELKNEENYGTSIIKPEGYDLVNLEDNFNLINMKYGLRNTMYDKCCLFNKTKIKDINWIAGAHVCNPIGNIKYNYNKYKLYHYKYLNPQFTIDRYKMTAKRLSEINLKTGMGNYVLSSEDTIKTEYISRRSNAIKVIE